MKFIPVSESTAALGVYMTLFDETPRNVCPARTSTAF